MVGSSLVSMSVKKFLRGFQEPSHSGRACEINYISHMTILVQYLILLRSFSFAWMNHEIYKYMKSGHNSSNLLIWMDIQIVNVLYFQRCYIFSCLSFFFCMEKIVLHENQDITYRSHKATNCRAK